MKVQVRKEARTRAGRQEFEVEVSIYDTRSADFWVHVEGRRAGFSLLAD